MLPLFGNCHPLLIPCGSSHVSGRAAHMKRSPSTGLLKTRGEGESFRKPLVLRGKRKHDTLHVSTDASSLFLFTTSAGPETFAVMITSRGCVKRGPQGDEHSFPSDRHQSFQCESSYRMNTSLQLLTAARVQKEKHIKKPSKYMRHLPWLG